MCLEMKEYAKNVLKMKLRMNNYFYKFIRNVKILLPCQMNTNYFGC